MHLNYTTPNKIQELKIVRWIVFALIYFELIKRNRIKFLKTVTVFVLSCRKTKKVLVCFDKCKNLLVKFKRSDKILLTTHQKFVSLTM